MGKKSEVRKKGSRYDKSVKEDLDEAEKEAQKKPAPATESKEMPMKEEKPKSSSKGRFHMMFEM